MSACLEIGRVDRGSPAAARLCCSSLFSLSFFSFRSDAQHQEPDRGWQESIPEALWRRRQPGHRLLFSAVWAPRNQIRTLFVCVLCFADDAVICDAPDTRLGLYLEVLKVETGRGPTMSFHGRMCTNTKSISLYRFYFIAQSPNHSRTQCVCLIFLLYE